MQDVLKEIEKAIDITTTWTEMKGTTPRLRMFKGSPDGWHIVVGVFDDEIYDVAATAKRGLVVHLTPGLAAKAARAALTAIDKKEDKP